MDIINFVVESLVNRLINNQIISNDDRDVYKYGLEVFVSLLTKIILLTIIAYIFNVIIEMAIFASTFFILRTNAGGYHAKTFLGCFTATVMSIFITVQILNNILVSFYFTLIILIIANILIFLYAPVDTPNKVLTQKEYYIYRKRSLKFAALFTLGIIMIYLVDATKLYYCNFGVFAFLLESLTLTPLVNKKI